MARSYTNKTLKTLWGRAAMRCSKCRCYVYDAADAPTDKDVLVGKIAHIIAHSDTGPRGDADFPVEKRDQYDNLILLCGNCHDLVDGQPTHYDVASLRKMKARHEAWVEGSLADAMPSVTFVELEEVTRAVAKKASIATDVIELTPPSAKLSKNGLGESTRELVNIGMLKVGLVRDYLVHASEFHSDFAERLLAGLVAEYDALVADGLRGDALFEALIDSIAAGRAFESYAAAIAVIVYFFEACDLFDP